MLEIHLSPFPSHFYVQWYLSVACTAYISNNSIASNNYDPYIRTVAGAIMSSCDMRLCHVTAGQVLTSICKRTLKKIQLLFVKLSQSQVLGCWLDVLSLCFSFSFLWRLKDFNEWSQSLVLQVLSRYKPAGEDEVFDILVSVMT